MNAGAVGRLVRDTRDAWASHAGDGGLGFYVARFSQLSRDWRYRGSGIGHGCARRSSSRRGPPQIGGGRGGTVVDRSPEVHEAAGQRSATAGEAANRAETGTWSTSSCGSLWRVTRNDGAACSDWATHAAISGG